LPRISLTIEQVLTVLAETPRRIAELTAGIPAADLLVAPSRDEWSANDVLAHLRACADMWGGFIVAILAEDMPTLKAVNPRTWIKSTDYLELAFRPSLRSFAAQRDELMTVLQTLTQDGWARAATVVGGGRPLELTVLDYARRLARHERPHVKQVARAVQTSHR
jgi:hypothetical protein